MTGQAESSKGKYKGVNNIYYLIIYIIYHVAFASICYHLLDFNLFDDILLAEIQLINHVKIFHRKLIYSSKNRRI